MLFETKKEYAVLLRVSAIIILSLSVLYVLNDKINEIISFISQYTDYHKPISIMLKGAIISFITTLCSDICSECGSVSVGKVIQFAGRVMIFILSYPLIETVIKTAVSFSGE